MTDDSLPLAEGVNVPQPRDEFQTLVYTTVSSPASWLFAPYSFPPRGNMAFEVNTICFVTFVLWLNNGWKFADKWDSEAGMGVI